MIGAEPAADRIVCSRAGCDAGARWRIQWRNPAIHGEDRVKVWTACDDHVDYLREFLAARSFPVTVLPIGSPSA